MEGEKSVTTFAIKEHEAHVQSPITLNIPSFSTSSLLNNLPFVRLCLNQQTFIEQLLYGRCFHNYGLNEYLTAALVR